MNDQPEDGDVPNEQVASSRQPIFNLPATMVVTILLLAGIYLVQGLVLSDDAVDWLLTNFGFISARYAAPLSIQGPQLFWTPVTYSLLHGSAEHIIFNGLWLTIFGVPVLRRIGTLRYLIFWILSATAAAAFHAALNWGDPTVLIGASGVISGLMGAACRFAFPPPGTAVRPPHLNARLSMAGTFKSRTARTFIIIWLIGNLLIAFGLPLLTDGSQAIAWDAHIGGFLFGFILFGFFDRPQPEWPPVTRDEEMLQS